MDGPPYAPVRLPPLRPAAVRPVASDRRRRPVRSDLANVLRRVGDQGQMARPLDGHGQAPLMLGARPRPAPRQDAPALVHVPRERRDILIVDRVDLVGAECADLAAAPTPAATPSAEAPATTSAAPSAAIAFPRLSAFALSVLALFCRVIIRQGSLPKYPAMGKYSRTPGVPGLRTDKETRSRPGGSADAAERPPTAGGSALLR